VRFVPVDVAGGISFDLGAATPCSTLEVLKRMLALQAIEQLFRVGGGTSGVREAKLGAPMYNRAAPG
jgi:hypothetical protein